MKSKNLIQKSLVKAKLLKIQKHIIENRYDYIVPGCNDKSYLSLAVIAEKLNYPGFDNYETALIIHHKDKFRVFAEKQNYPIPKFVNDIKKINTLKLPIVIKPADSHSGRGINKFETYQDIEKYLKNSKNYLIKDNIIAEEFVRGKLYSHSSFIKNKKIIVDFFVNEYSTIYPFQVK